MHSVEDYIRDLISRIDTASAIERRHIEIEDWQPIEHRCHDNVAKLCKLNRTYSHIYGFLISDTSEFGFITFFFHSIAKDPDGNLLDITPTSARNSYPFLPCELPDEAYKELMYMYEKEGQICVQT